MREGYTLKNNACHDALSKLTSESTQQICASATYQLVNDKSAIAAQTLQSLISRVGLIFCAMWEVPSAEYYENEEIYSGSNGYMKNILSVVCLNLLGDRSLFNEMESLMINARANIVKHTARDVLAMNCKESISVYNKWIKALGKAVDSDIFEKVKLSETYQSSDYSNPEQRIIPVVINGKNMGVLPVVMNKK